MDYNLVREKAIEWMIERDWKRITAKHGNYDQSLFEHTINELDALLVLWPILSVSWRLNDQDLAALAVGTVAHDVGKEKPEWQEYVLSEKGRTRYVPHVVEELTQVAVEELFEQLGLSGSADDAKAFVRYHMRGTKTADSLIFDVINKGSKSDRWMTLSELVAEIDNVCSARGLLEGMQALERGSLSKHLKVTYHLVQIRGVSTVLLHQAAMDAYEAAGWQPLLHYSNGTIYVAGSMAEVCEPSLDSIESRLAALVRGAMGGDFADTVVTRDFRASAISVPPLFDYREIREYLIVAGTRVTGGENRFAKQLQSSSGRSSVEKKIRDYLNQSSGVQAEAIESNVLIQQSQRISRAYPEMCIFKFFKAVMNIDLIGRVVTDEARERYWLELSENRNSGNHSKVTPQMIAQAEYERAFGQGTFANLMRTSTLMPAKDMALTIDPYWSSPGQRFGLPTVKVEFSTDEARRAALVEALALIAQNVYASLPQENRPVRTSSDEIAARFLCDLLHPSSQSDWASAASAEMTAYDHSKATAKSSKGDHFCPICNSVFGEGSAAKAAYLDKPESHSNRAISHGSPGYIVICPACKYERFIQQLLLGGKPSELLVLAPRMNIDPKRGTELVRKIREFWSRARMLMSNDTPDPNQRISLSLTQMIARKFADHDVFSISPHELLDMFCYSTSALKQKDYRKILEQNLREAFGGTVDDLNESWATDFGDWDSAVQALIDGKVMENTALQIRTDAYKLQPTMNVVCRTPHFILIPLLRGIGIEGESEVNGAIRQLFSMLILGLAFDCSVAILGSGDVINFEGGEGIARVPRVPALRDLVGAEWISLNNAERWLRAIGASSLVAQSTGLPERSNLYQILRAPTPGHILRRIEQHSDSGTFSHEHIKHLEILKEVLR